MLFQMHMCVHDVGTPHVCQDLNIISQALSEIDWTGLDRTPLPSLPPTHFPSPSPLVVVAGYKLHFWQFVQQQAQHEVLLLTRPLIWRLGWWKVHVCLKRVRVNTTGSTYRSFQRLHNYPWWVVVWLCGAAALLSVNQSVSDVIPASSWPLGKTNPWYHWCVLFNCVLPWMKIIG